MKLVLNFNVLVIGHNPEGQLDQFRTGPYKKFKSYVMGGRWSGYFSLREGRDGILGGSKERHPEFPMADSAFKMDIKFHNKLRSTYAVLYHGYWVSQEDMGWFGNLSKEHIEELWEKEFDRIITNVSAYERLSIFQCDVIEQKEGNKNDTL